MPFVLVTPEVFAAAARDETTLDRETAHHLANVVKLKGGADLEVSDGFGNVAAGRLVGRDRLLLTATPAQAPRPTPPITVVQGVAKGRKVDEVVRVLTELGVDAITVVTTARSVSKLDGERARKALDRWQAVARAACSQARRPWLPTITGPLEVAEVMAAFRRDETPGIVAHVGAASGLREALEGLGTPENGLVAAIGPEGGWTNDEVQRWERAGLRGVGLGASVLRTEHAGVVAATVLSYHLGRLA